MEPDTDTNGGSAGVCRDYAKDLVTHPLWDWDKAEGALVWCDDFGVTTFEGETSLANAIVDGFNAASGRVLAHDRFQREHEVDRSEVEGSSIRLDLTAPSTQGIVQQMCWELLHGRKANPSEVFGTIMNAVIHDGMDFGYLMAEMLWEELEKVQESTL